MNRPHSLVLGDKGFSLVEIMIAVGLMGMVAGGVVAVNKIGFMGQKAMMAQDNSRLLTEDAAALLGDPAACLRTFNTIPASLPGGAPIPATGAGGTWTSATNGFYSATGAVASYSPTKIYGGNLTLDSITIGFNSTTGNAGFDKRYGVQQWSGPAVGAFGNGQMVVLLDWEQRGTSANNGAGSQGTQHLLRILKVNTQVDTQGHITYCSALASAGGGGGGVGGSGNPGFLPLWTSTTSLGDSIVFQDTTNTKVGIGTTSPAYALDISKPGDANAGTTGILNLAFTSPSNSQAIQITQSNAGGDSQPQSALFEITNVGLNPYFNFDNIFYMNKSGAVGIGTTAPSAKLDVVGTLQTRTNLGGKFPSINSAVSVGGGTLFAWNGGPTTIGESDFINIFRNGSNNKSGGFGFYNMKDPANVNTTPVVFFDGDAMTLPSSAAPPASPVNGMIRYNTTSNIFEGYQANKWQPLISSSASDAFVNSGNAFGKAAILGTTDNNSLTIITNNNTTTPGISISSTGKVGIGTNNPWGFMDVTQNNDGATTAVRVRNNGSGAGTEAEWRIVEGNGPQEAYASFQVLDEGTPGAPLIANRMVSSSTVDRVVIGSDAQANHGTLKGGAHTGVPIFFNQANVNVMTISATSNVGIGINGPGYKLDVVGDINATGCLRATGGNIGGTCSSDERLKTEIHPFDLGLDALLGISPKTFRYNGLGGHPASEVPEMGVIAQDLERAAPELVASAKVKLHESDDGLTEIKQVNYTSFVYVLINAVKELYHRWMDDSAAIHRELASKASGADLRQLQTDNDAKTRAIQQLSQENAALKERLDRIERSLQGAK